MEGKDWEEKALVSELILGFEAAKKLQARLGEAVSPSLSYCWVETNEILVKQILSSYEKSLVMLNLSSVSVGKSGGVPESPASINGSPRSEEFVDGGGWSESPCNLSSKKRKMLPKWTEKVRISPERGLEGPQDDVFSWRKYGQKDILGAKFPRSYYRCTHRSTHNCWATKQVQRSDNDPTVFQVTYRGTHTCSQPKPTTSLHDLKTNLTVRTHGLDADDVFSFPNTPPFHAYVDSSPLFDLDWFNPTVEIDTAFPSFLHDSIYY